MPLYQGDAPTILVPSQILGSVLLQAAELYDRHPASAFFMQGGALPVHAARVFIEERAQYRQLGKLHAAHGPADRAPSESVGARAERVLFQYYKDLIPADILGALQPAPTYNSLDAAARIAANVMELNRQQAEEQRDRILMGFTALCARTFEDWSCKVLQGGNYTITVDDVSLTVTSPVPLSSTAQGVTLGNWNSPTAPIPQDLALMIDDATDRFGRRPTHMMYSSALRQNFAKNENVIKIMEGGSATAFGFLVNPPTQIISPEAMEIARVEHWGTHKATPSTAATRFWSTDRIVFWDSTRDGLKVITRPTLAHSNQEAYQHPLTSEGFFARVWPERETGGEWVGVGHNGAPVVMDREGVVAYNIGAK